MESALEDGRAPGFGKHPQNGWHGSQGGDRRIEHLRFEISKGLKKGGVLWLAREDSAYFGGGARMRPLAARAKAKACSGGNFRPTCETSGSGPGRRGSIAKAARSGGAGSATK